MNSATASPAASHAAKAREAGFVTEAKQYVLTLEGLPSARLNDVLVGESGERAIVRALKGDQLKALLLDPVMPRAGDRYGFNNDAQLYSLGDHLFGRVLSVLGEPADQGPAFPTGNTPLMLDIDAPGIEYRLPIEEQLHTGLMLVDILLPIAKGQRQLLFGPVRGKTDFLIDVVLNQSAYDTICIYALIGKTLPELERVTSRILGRGSKNIVLAALSDQTSPRIWLAPSVAFLIAEHFQKQGKDVLVILDDLAVHAKYLREIALLEERLPGRESYPGDLFYQHAHLLERCGRFGPELGGGSITVIPVTETDPNASLDIVSTNLMSCTDGHLLFQPSLQAEGVYPAIAEDLSITRIGHSAQKLLEKQLSAEIRMRLSAARREQEYAQFGAQVSKAAEEKLKTGAIIERIMRQEPGRRIPVGIQVPLLALALSPFLLERDAQFAAGNKQKLIDGITGSAGLAELRDLALGDMPLADYQKKIEAKRSAFESLCRA